MVTPEEAKALSSKNISVAKIEQMEEDIDSALKRVHGWYPWKEAILENEYSIELRDAVAKKYKDAGWKYVYHATTSELGERAGLTCFKFSMSPIEYKNVKGYKEV